MNNLASSVIKRTTYKKEESEQNDSSRHSMCKFPSKILKADVNHQEFVSNSEILNKNKKDHYARRPTKQLIQVYGEFNIDEFSKIGNQFSNETVSNKIYRRSEIMQSQPNDLLKNPTNNFQNYPTINSVMENNLDESNLSHMNNNDNSNFNRKADNINDFNDFFQNNNNNNNFNMNKNKSIGFNTNNTISKNANNFNNGTNFQNKNENNNPSHNEKISDNIMWDFTKNDTNNNNNNIKANVNTLHISNDDNRIAPINKMINYTENNVDLNSNEINFDELLGSSKNKFTEKNVNNQNLNPRPNNIINKDPFEGFY